EDALRHVVVPVHDLGAEWHALLVVDVGDVVRVRFERLGVVAERAREVDQRHALAHPGEGVAHGVASLPRAVFMTRVTMASSTEAGRPVFSIRPASLMASVTSSICPSVGVYPRACSSAPTPCRPEPRPYTTLRPACPTASGGNGNTYDAPSGVCAIALR